MNKGILFFLGLLAGIMICLTLHYYETKLLKRIVPDYKEKEIVIRFDTIYVETPQKPKKQDAKHKLDQPVVAENEEDEQQEEEVSFYDTEFSFDGDEQDEVVSEQLLKTKTVKVKISSQEKEVKLPDNFFHFFEIQQWSTPIKNKITYYRVQNMIKIKGMEIDNVNVVFFDDTYFLEVGNRYYAIPETESYTKMNLIPILQ